ncbi:hypothetical protein [Colwellia sp. TT2012]|nr:hypothetical protein [Colwellia sp. TT2012]
MPSNLLAMINTRNPKAIAISNLLVVNRMWLVKRQLNWPVTAQH